MIKYIVTWCLLAYVSQRCPVQKDEFGRSVTPKKSCNQYQEDCGHVKTFTNRDQAKAFYKRALVASKDDDTVKIFSVKLDSIKPNTK